MALSIETTGTDDVRTIHVVGEVDVSNAQELRSALDACLEQAPKTIEVDMAKLSYIDSTGIGVLVGAANRAKEVGSALTLASPQRNVARVLALLGVDDKMGLRS